MWGKKWGLWIIFWGLQVTENNAYPAKLGKFGKNGRNEKIIDLDDVT